MDEAALILMIANSDPSDVCYYPDSHKFVVESTGTLVYDHPQLDYFDGETLRATTAYGRRRARQ